jgi:hypothetical protein
MEEERERERERRRGFERKKGKRSVSFEKELPRTNDESHSHSEWYEYVVHLLRRRKGLTTREIKRKTHRSEGEARGLSARIRS